MSYLDDIYIDIIQFHYWMPSKKIFILAFSDSL